MVKIMMQSSYNERSIIGRGAICKWAHYWKNPAKCSAMHVVLCRYACHYACRYTCRTIEETFLKYF